MIRFTYKRGLVFIEGQMRWTLERLLVTGKYQLISDAGEIVARQLSWPVRVNYLGRLTLGNLLS